VALGGPVWLQFENERTVRHQIQEMLRAERQFEPAAIAEEIAAAAPLLPDGGDWRAALLIGLPAAADGRVHGLDGWAGLPAAIGLTIAGQPTVRPEADADLAPESRGAAHTVHFLRFAFDAGARRAVRAGATVTLKVDHPCLRAGVPLAGDTRDSLIGDWTADD
jgi:hypothetical protein